MRRAMVVGAVLALFAAGYAAGNAGRRIIRLHTGQRVRIGNVLVIDVSKPKVRTVTVTRTATTTVAATSTATPTTMPQPTHAPATTPGPHPQPQGSCGTRVGQQPLTDQRVVWILFENKSYGAIIGNPDAPYLNSLAA